MVINLKACLLSVSISSSFVLFCSSAIKSFIKLIKIKKLTKKLFGTENLKCHPHVDDTQHIDET